MEVKMRNDRMDKIVAAAARQGFWVRQTRTGTWFFSKGIANLTFERTPITPQEWTTLLNTLRGFGLRFPDRE
jgi:hypothetical protein